MNLYKTQIKIVKKKFARKCLITRNGLQLYPNLAKLKKTVFKEKNLFTKLNNYALIIFYQVDVLGLNLDNILQVLIKLRYWTYF